MAKRITGRMSDGTPFVLSETGNEGVGYITTQRRLPEIIIKLAKLEDKIENGDLIEVVRCNDCKYCTQYEAANGLRLCKCDYVKFSGFLLDDYCSYGERKDSNNG